MKYFTICIAAMCGISISIIIAKYFVDWNKEMKLLKRSSLRDKCISLIDSDRECYKYEGQNV